MKNEYYVIIVNSSTHYKTKGINLNRLTWPVIEQAINDADDYKRMFINRETIALAKAANDEEIERLERKYQVIFENLYDISIGGLHPDKIIVPTDTLALLTYLSRKYLCMDPKYGIKMLIEAYNKQYATGIHCLQCERPFTQLIKGRCQKYCSNKCRQKAYRQQKKHKKHTQ